MHIWFTLAEFTEPLLPIPEPLANQFNMRMVYVIGEGDIDDRFSPSYWASTPAHDDPDQDLDLVRANRNYWVCQLFIWCDQACK